MQEAARLAKQKKKLLTFKYTKIMKKILVMIVLAVSAMTSMAQSISQEILGVKIGETMQEDVHNILIAQNLEYDWKYDNTYYYKGAIKHENGMRLDLFLLIIS